MTTYNQADMQRFQSLLQAYEQAVNLPYDDENRRRTLDILEEMHLMIHQNRVPLHVGKHFCGLPLASLYEQLEQWDRYLHWMIRTRDIEKNALRKLGWTRVIIRLSEKCNLDNQALAKALLQNELNPDVELPVPCEDRVKYYLLKAEIAHRSWRETRQLELLDWAIVWAERAHHAGGADSIREALERLRAERRNGDSVG